MDPADQPQESSPEESQNQQPEVTQKPAQAFVSPRPKRSYKKLLLIVAVVLLIGATAFIFWTLGRHSSKTSNNITSRTTNNTPATKASSTANTAANLPGVQLDPNKNYGNKYADGLLPVGDGKYVTDAAKQGYVYVCHANFVPAGQAGAQVRGPWFTNNNTEWDVNKKAHIEGNVSWSPSLSIDVSSGTRTVSTNDLPNHPTGVFPVSTNDPAYTYDRNPNRIAAQTLIYALNASPTYGQPNCMGGEVGVMTTGVALFDGFDAGGRDAGAWEIQDSCSGHPQNKGEYHYHTLSSCIKDTSVHTVIGYALDGFPITGPMVGSNNILTTSDLDECHGITSQINLDSKSVTMYHYVMTQDFPYSASCFRSTPIKAPGLPE